MEGKHISHGTLKRKREVISHVKPHNKPMKAHTCQLKGFYTFVYESTARINSSVQNPSRLYEEITETKIIFTNRM